MWECFGISERSEDENFFVKFNKNVREKLMLMLNNKNFVFCSCFFKLFRLLGIGCFSKSF